MRNVSRLPAIEIALWMISNRKENKRLDRYLADHLARQGMLETASMIIKVFCHSISCHSDANEVTEVNLQQEEKLENFVDLDVYKEVFISAAPILAALLEGDCSPVVSSEQDKAKKGQGELIALARDTAVYACCAQSNLEFLLRLQSFVELVRKEALQVRAGSSQVVPSQCACLTGSGSICAEAPGTLLQGKLRDCQEVHGNLGVPEGHGRNGTDSNRLSLNV
eukprot:745622-Hanusia_phi.AAC.1